MTCIYNVEIFLALEGVRLGWNGRLVPQQGPRVPPVVRGWLAVLLNPGAWLFLAAVASPLLARASQAAGAAGAVSSAIALMGGAALGDVGVVLIGAKALRRAGPSISSWLQRGLAAILAALGAWLILSAFVP